VRGWKVRAFMKPMNAPFDLDDAPDTESQKLPEAAE
jgi:hypothetical protein